MPFPLREASSGMYRQVSIDEDDQGSGIVMLETGQQDNDHNDNSISHEGEYSDFPASPFQIGDDSDDNDDDDNDNVDVENPQPLTSTSSAAAPSTPTTFTNTSKLPSNYVCPLTMQVMHEPVHDGCGHCFEREAIIGWLEYHEMCPISRKPLDMQLLRPADGLAARIQEWRDQHGDSADFAMEGSSSGTVTTELSERMESLLLPQEMAVLQIINDRARDRRSKREFHNCLWALAVTVSILLVIVACWAIKFLEMEIKGPL